MYAFSWCPDDTYTHKGTEHVDSSMCHTIVVPFQSFNRLHAQLFPKPGAQKHTFSDYKQHWSKNVGKKLKEHKHQ